MTSGGEDLAREYRLNLLAKLARIEQLRSALAGGSAPPAEVADLLRDLHSIAGSAQVFGLPAVSDAARAAEHYVAEQCSGSARPGPAQWAELRALLEKLRLLFERRA
jgi:HPt (histidine-containing phosphotransfer) domain-containing protein